MKIIAGFVSCMEVNLFVFGGQRNLFGGQLNLFGGQLYLFGDQINLFGDQINLFGDQINLFVKSICIQFSDTARSSCVFGQLVRLSSFDNRDLGNECESNQKFEPYTRRGYEFERQDNMDGFV